MRTRRLQWTVLLFLLAALSLLIWKQQAVLDWWHLRGYTAPNDVARLAADDTMTPAAKRLFYVNRPDITSGKDFTSNCPQATEKTVILGCYVGRDNGIYIYRISDARLNGVEQVTAAHEMLHAAYRRLSAAERAHVDAMLTDYYNNDLTDQRIKDTIDAYKRSEPNDVVNEMHSIFGTEVANLPAPLEGYYSQYFSDRAKVAAFTASYQGEFTGRQAQVSAYDTQLSALKTQIGTDEATLKKEKAGLDSQSQQLQNLRGSGQVAAYNAAVPGYNQAVDNYNALIGDTRNLINQYNDIVARRNAIALEEQQLAAELSANSLPAAN